MPSSQVLPVEFLKVAIESQARSLRGQQARPILTNQFERRVATEMPVGELLADADASLISATCATEAFEVAMAKKIPLGFDDPVSYTRDFGGKIPGARPSMYLDFLAKRRCEIDAINGAIPVAAAEEGMTAPANVVVSSLIRSKESRF